MANPAPHLRRKQDEWTGLQLALLRKKFPSTDTAALAKQIKKSLPAVLSKATALGLKKSAWYWKPAHENWLLRNYPVMSAEELVQAMKDRFGIEKTTWALINKYRKLIGKKK